VSRDQIFCKIMLVVWDEVGWSRRAQDHAFMFPCFPDAKASSIQPVATGNAEQSRANGNEE